MKKIMLWSFSILIFIFACNSLCAQNIREVKSLTDAYKNPESVEWLNLSRQNLKSIPDLSSFSNLKLLNLSYNEICEIPSKYIRNLNKLEVLIAAGNKIIAIPSEINSCQNLRVIDFQENKINELPNELFELENLTDLILFDNQISFLPSNISNLKKLRQLSLSRNKLSVLPESIGSLTQLYELFLAYNQLTGIPSSLKESKILVLELQNNHITSFPLVLSECNNLMNLQLYNNDFNSIPLNVINLPYLIQFSLDEDDLNKESKRFYKSFTKKNKIGTGVGSSGGMGYCNTYNYFIQDNEYYTGGYKYYLKILSEKQKSSKHLQNYLVN